VALANAGIILLVYGGLGYLGYFLSRMMGFSDIWDPAVTNRQRFLIPGVIGAALGIFLIAADSVFSRFHTLGPLPHPPFPASLLASASAGIGEEIIFRLFFISFWTWIIFRLILKGKGQEIVFWVVTVLSALAFAVGHIPAVMALYEYNSLTDIPGVLIAEIILLNGIISVFTAWSLRRYGLLAPIGIHFWTDVVWHVIWGSMT
jgi:hypothetical protein